MVKNLWAMLETQVRSQSWEDPLEREWQPTPVLLTREFQGQRSLQGYISWDCKELDATERLHFLHFFWDNSPWQHHPSWTCFFIEGPLPLSSHESLPASFRRPILIGKPHPHEGLITWLRLHSLASHQILSLNPQFSMTGLFLGLRTGRVGCLKEKMLWCCWLLGLVCLWVSRTMDFPQESQSDRFLSFWFFKSSTWWNTKIYKSHLASIRSGGTDFQE